MSRSNTVRGAVYGAPPVEVEYHVGGFMVVKAGMLLHLSTNGMVLPEDASSQANNPPSQILIASGNTILGKSISDEWEYAAGDYQVGDLVPCFIGRRGDKFYGWLAPGEVIEIGEPLLGNGQSVGMQWGGTLTKGVVPIGDITLQLGFATENVDNLLGAFPVRVMVEVH